MTNTARMVPSVPALLPKSENFVTHLNAFLDKHILPYPVKYLTNRITILATLALLIPLIIFANEQVFVLLANSYLNVMSVVVSSTVLLFSTLSESRDRTAADRREAIAQAQDQITEKRAEADHLRIQDIHDHMDQMHKELIQHVNTSLDNIQKILVERLEKIQNEDHVHVAETHKAILETNQSQAAELADLRELVEALHKKGSSAAN